MLGRERAQRPQNPHFLSSRRCRTVAQPGTKCSMRGAGQVEPLSLRGFLHCLVKRHWQSGIERVFFWRFPHTFAPHFA